MLAGGICKENLIEALQITKAPIIDISSGLESKKGIKSVKKIKEFLKLVKSINSKNVYYLLKSSPSLFIPYLIDLSNQIDKIN